MATAFLPAFGRCMAMLGTGSRPNNGSNADSDGDVGNEGEGEMDKGGEGDCEGGGGSLARGAAAVCRSGVMFDPPCKEFFLRPMHPAACCLAKTIPPPRALGARLSAE